MQQWFKHDFEAHRDRKLISLRLKKGFEGVGMFWTLIEIVGETEERAWPKSQLPELAEELRVDEPKLREFVTLLLSLHLLTEDDEWIWSNGTQKRMAEFDTKSEQATAAINKRWENERKKHGIGN